MRWSDVISRVGEEERGDRGVRCRVEGLSNGHWDVGRAVRGEAERVKILGGNLTLVVLLM